jgi:hypothetical protein
MLRSKKLETDEIDAIIRAAGRGSQYLIAFSCYRTGESVGRPAKFAHGASLLSARGETPEWYWVVQSCFDYIMSFRFLGHLKAAIGGSLKSLVILLLSYRMARWLLRMVQCRSNPT